MPVILLRNFTSILVNGTRLIIQDVRTKVAVANVTLGPARGEVVYIPQLFLDTSRGVLPFTLRRLEMRLSPAFAITLNKAQGQTLERVKKKSPTHIFSHCQAYVALSRLTDPGNLYIY